ncbi:fibrinogen C domain-containing protein 1-like [Physella acuta]|uniref:fibrinogen C domain-containing protein 1-like n=1 Tax=Physella acuta TaxID=109671 RepID=UPI0027DE8E88|nr:fibrinogen C domain-containing protein 1-like [Physella acuta]
MILQLCVLCCLVSGVSADNGKTYNDNSTRSKRSSVEEFFTPNTCLNCASSQPRQVVILSNGFQVMCDTLTDGGGWTVIQRRFNGQTDFYRGWEEYKYGFGNMTDGDFWLGNEKIHRLTTERQYELRVDFTFNGQNFYARYSSFCVYGLAEFYKLKVSGYSGNAGDSLTQKHNNMRFSTFDVDNDPVSDNCALAGRGGWWYNNCHTANLNGKWGSTVFGVGVNWFDTTTYTASATFTEMKIRPV